MAIQQEFWLKYIMMRLWKDNAFLKYAYKEDDYVLNGKVVHIPQPGTKPTVVKNRSVTPATAVTRTDTDILYSLDEYTTDPTKIGNAEKVELSYDKIGSVFGDHAGQLSETFGDDMIIKWLDSIAAGNILHTTGAAANVTEPGQTGQRLVMLAKDLQRAKLLMNKQNVAKDGRIALLEENMADQLFTSLSDSQYRDFSQYADAKNGTIGRLHGFDIMTRSNVAFATSADVITPLGTAVAATHNVVSMCYQKDAVALAMGEKKFFEKIDDPLYYGDVYSALIRGGGRRRRSDDAGVVALVASTT